VWYDYKRISTIIIKRLKSMQNNKNRPPVLSQFIRRQITPHRQGVGEAISYDLSIKEADSGGYNPYDNPAPPPTEAQLDEAARRRSVRRLRK
jgi:hypothetical protein